MATSCTSSAAPRRAEPVAVRRIIANVATDDPAAASRFYAALLGMQVVMDMGWIVTLAADAVAPPQLSFASSGGSGAPVPDLSIEVDDWDDVLRRARAAGLALEYGPVSEPWGVKRFFLRDPAGRLVNILSHAP